MAFVPRRNRIRRPASCVHLPSPGENIVYILAVAISPILNFFVQQHLLPGFHPGNLASLLPKQRESSIVLAYGLMFSLVLLVLLYLIVRTSIHRVPHVRPVLGAFGLACSIDLLINFLILNAAIVHLKMQSYQLLLEAVVFYVSLNLVFFFWYWYIDYLEQLCACRQPNHRPSIQFPEHAEGLLPGWLPGPVDYLFFTALSSNTLGPPEGHPLLGHRAKLVQIVHTGSALFIFVILVARAINTLG